MIYGKDGKPYKPSGCYQLFNDKLPERDLVNKWDAEALKMGGSPIYYYEIFIDINNIDPLLMESRAPIWSQVPITLYGTYPIAASENNQGFWGLDNPTGEVPFEFNYKNVLETLGHPPKIGSRLQTPFLNEQWEIIENKTGDYRFYQSTRLICICSRFQEDRVSGTSIAKQPDVNFEII